MSTITIDQHLDVPMIQGVTPLYLPLLGPESNFSLLITAPNVHYKLEAPLVAAPLIQGNKIVAKFIVDENAYLDLTLTGKSIEQENKFRTGQFTLFYRITEMRPRPFFISSTLMAVMGLARRVDLKISEPDVSTWLNFELPLLEISKWLYRRQTAYRLMVIEKLTGVDFLLPPAISERDAEKIAFVYHALVDRSFTWSSGSFEAKIPATQENLSLLAQPTQPFAWSRSEESICETVFDQPVALGRALVTIEDAIVRRLSEDEHGGIIKDEKQVNVVVHSLSGQVKYRFTDAPNVTNVLWDEKVQALIDLEPQLDAALVERYHALASATLADLTEEEKKEVTTRPDLGEAFLIDKPNGD